MKNKYEIVIIPGLNDTIGKQYKITYQVKGSEMHETTYGSCSFEKALDFAYEKACEQFEKDKHRLFAFFPTVDDICEQFNCNEFRAQEKYFKFRELFIKYYAEVITK